MEKFNQVFSIATSKIDEKYFRLVVEGEDVPVFRERVYCYELYHQLRDNWTDRDFQICGEIDKRGHPILRGSTETPDLLVHIPGRKNNFAIVEIKPADFDRQKLIKDFKTITKFMSEVHAGYKRGICLIYGDKPRLIRNIENATSEFAQEGNNASKLSKIEIWHHPSVGSEAKHISVSGTKEVSKNTHYENTINFVDTVRFRGIKEDVRKIVIEMKADGVLVSKISQYTGLSEEEIERL